MSAAPSRRVRFAHRLSARLAALRTARRWRAQRRNLDRPTVAVALVEHMGDIVAAEPVARRVRALYPQAHIVWVVRPAYAQLPRAFAAVDEVLLVRCLTEWIHLSRADLFDAVFDLHLDGRDCARCKVPIRRDVSGHGVTLHNYYADGPLLSAFCRSAGLAVLDDGPVLDIPADVQARIAGRVPEEPYVVVHARANQTGREWNDAAWDELTTGLHARTGMPIVEVGLDPVLAAGGVDRSRLCGSLSLLETAEVIRRATLFVGIDSGPAHLANAVGTPGVVLLGHYSRYERYVPYTGPYATGEGATLVHWPGPVRELPVREAAEAVLERLERVAAGRTG
ncbi:MAG: glycosyltransferase family 9 protein [Gemmatimonadota bacterium]|nr:glycosyltransferase family 9 protein [Gemmatimonadota bacterium]